MLTEKYIREYLLELGAFDVGFAKTPDKVSGLHNAISIVVALSEAVIDEISDKPTHTYYSHYIESNSLINFLIQRAGVLLQKNGYKWLPVSASQTINTDGWNYAGRYSHKKAARLAGLGYIGKSAMFIHKEYGPAVRLGTVFTDFECEQKEVLYESCKSCMICAKNCPASAIIGINFKEGMERADLFDAAACSNYMKDKFKDITRGNCCGICISVCPKRKKA